MNHTIRDAQAGDGIDRSTHSGWAAGVVAVASVVSVIAFTLLEWGHALATAALILLVPTLMFGARARRTPAPLLIAVWVGCAAFGAAYLGGNWFTDRGTGLLVTNLLLLIGLASAIGGIGLLLHSRRGTETLSVLGDSILVWLGSWLVGWVAVSQPMASHHTDSVLNMLVESLVFPTGAVLLFITAVLLLGQRRPNLAGQFLAIAIVAIVCSSVVRLLQISGQVSDVRALSEAALAVAVIAVAVSIVLGATSRGAQPSGPTRTLSPMRRQAQLVLTTAWLVFPVVVLAASGPNNVGDRIARSIVAFTLAVAVILRVLQSIRSSAKAHANLLRRAQTDPLTGLPNRMVVLERISSYVHESWCSDRVPTVFFLDLDRFKNINDSLGHAAGDEVLRMVGRRLVEAAPTGAMVARLSGDEYVILDPTTPSLTAAAAVAERLLAVFHDPFPLPEGDVFVTASIGVASVESVSAKPDDILRHADTAMYRAKDAGRNCVTFYNDTMHQSAAHRLAVETALYRAIDREELRMFHQPILDLDTGDVVGFEALMRWDRSDGSVVSPAEFIPIAEDTGTILQIGAWALLEALNQLRRWIDDGVCSPTATMSVNVSPRQLADPNLPSIIREALALSGVDSSLLWVEITESVMITEPDVALRTLQQLKALGVRVALDDFGTGYSSLSLLRQFPLQRLKIDRAFVQGVADNPSDRSLVRTIIAMGTSLGLDLVAEGVETLQQMEVLHSLGCHKAQGYLISLPVPADAMRSTVSALQRLGTYPPLHGADPVGAR
jgi:diguanylate cyclase (GGDEF)-like protein